MNLVHEIELIIKQITGCDMVSANLATNAVLDRLEKLNLEITDKE